MKISDFGSFHGRLVAERELRGYSQTRLRLETGVGKTTQVKYESGESVPDVRYLIDLAEKGFDVLYLLTGRRDQATLTHEAQNLIDAYTDAPDHLKRAAFAVLISHKSSDAENAQTTPGWYRHELMGEEDVRYPEHMKAEREKSGARALPGQRDLPTSQTEIKTKR